MYGTAHFYCFRVCASQYMRKISWQPVMRQFGPPRNQDLQQTKTKMKIGSMRKNKNRLHKNLPSWIYLTTTILTFGRTLNHAVFPTLNCITCHCFPTAGMLENQPNKINESPIHCLVFVPKNAQRTPVLTIPNARHTRHVPASQPPFIYFIYLFCNIANGMTQ